MSNMSSSQRASTGHEEIRFLRAGEVPGDLDEAQRPIRDSETIIGGADANRAAEDRPAAGDGPAAVPIWTNPGACSWSSGSSARRSLCP